MNQEDIEIYETIGGSAAEPQVPSRKKSYGFGKGVIVGMISAFALVLVVWGGMTITRIVAASDGTNSAYQAPDREGILDEVTVGKLSQIEMLLDRYYLFDYTDEDMQEGVIKGMVSSLGDPYTVYYNEEETEELNMTTSGKYSGIGAVLTQDLKTMIITITRTYNNSPAKEYGLKEGDILVKVDGEDMTGKEVSQVVTYIRGEEGTGVTLTVLRDGEEMDIDVVRRNIEVETVEYEMLDNQVGYMEITSFDEVTLEQFETALNALKEQGMKSVIFDLRDNPGGLVDTCTAMLDDLLPEGLLVYTEDKNGKRYDYNSTGDDELGIPVVILVNENSASASEIFTGAMMDRAGAKVVGTTSFGKGIVQSVVDLGDGTSLKTTISEYFTPNGTKIHGIGIEPDYEVEENEKTENGEDVDAPLNKALEILGADR